MIFKKFKVSLKKYSFQQLNICVNDVLIHHNVPLQLLLAVANGSESLQLYYLLIQLKYYTTTYSAQIGERTATALFASILVLLSASVLCRCSRLRA